VASKFKVESVPLGKVGTLGKSTRASVPATAWVRRGATSALWARVSRRRAKDAVRSDVGTGRAASADELSVRRRSLIAAAWTHECASHIAEPAATRHWADHPISRSRCPPYRADMSTLLIIVVLVLLLGGGGGYYYSRRR
jgi:hypothetical protein